MAGFTFPGMPGNDGAALANQNLTNNGLSGPATSIPGQNLSALGAAPAIGAQNSLLSQLQMQASGTGGPTLAQSQLQSGLAGNLAATLAATSSQRGNNNPGVAQKQLQEAQVGANAQAAGQSAATRAAGMTSAQGLLGTTAAQGVNTAATQANLNQQSNLANQQAQEQYNQQIAQLTGANQASSNQLFNQFANPSTYLGMFSGGSSGLGSAAAASDEEVKTNVDKQATGMSSFLSQLGQKLGLSQPSEANPELSQGSDPIISSGMPQVNHMFGNAANAAPTDFPAPNGRVAGSRADMNVGNAQGLPSIAFPVPEQQATPYAYAPTTSASMILNNRNDTTNPLPLDNIGNHSYEYKNPNLAGAAPGEHFGPMAQELEASGPVGKSVVAQGPDGVKRVDTPRLTLALTGATAELEQRVKTLEDALRHRAGGNK